MSGAAVVRHLLANNAGVLAVVPATQIMAGVLPLNTPLPAISVMDVGAIPDNRIRITDAGKQHTERVQVTWLFSGTGYPGFKALGALVLAACPSQRGTVNGVSVDSIIPQPTGPDIYDDERILYAQSRDFLVKWNQT